MPQIDQITVSFVSQLVWLLGVLAIIYFGIAKTMLPKVQDTIDARAKRVADDLAAADKAHERADAIEEDYRTRMNEARSEANAVTAEAKTQAATEIEKRVAAADEKLDAKLAAAEAELDERRRAAMTEIESVATEATRQIVERISGASASEAEARSAVKEAMADG